MDPQHDSFLRDLAALVSGLEGTRRIAEALSVRDYGEAEPTGRFRAPKAEAR